MSSSYRLELNKWIAGLNVKADRVLDIGGAQLPIKSRVQSWDVKEYLISDLEDPHADSPKPDVIMDLNKHAVDLTIGQFDLIFCLEVFDYIYNPLGALQTIRHYLKYGGRAYITFPFVYPTHNPIEDDMLRYTEFAVRKYAKLTGLKIINIIARRPETNAIENLWRAERMRAAKHYDHNVTGWIVEFEK